MMDPTIQFLTATQYRAWQFLLFLSHPAKPDFDRLGIDPEEWSGWKPHPEGGNGLVIGGHGASKQGLLCFLRITWRTLEKLQSLGLCCFVYDRQEDELMIWTTDRFLARPETRSKNAERVDRFRDSATPNGAKRSPKASQESLQSDASDPLQTPLSDPISTQNTVRDSPNQAVVALQSGQKTASQTLDSRAGIPGIGERETREIDPSGDCITTPEGESLSLSSLPATPQPRPPLPKGFEPLYTAHQRWTDGEIADAFKSLGNRVAAAARGEKNPLGNQLSYVTECLVNARKGASNRPPPQAPLDSMPFVSPAPGAPSSAVAGPGYSSADFARTVKEQIERERSANLETTGTDGGGVST